MNPDDYPIKEKPLNLLEEDIDALYEKQDRDRLRESILLSDTEKFHLFTRMMRIDKMMQNAKITHVKIQE